MALIVKTPPANAGNMIRLGFNPWVGKIPWRREWQPIPVFLPAESHRQRSLGSTVHGVSELDGTGATQHTHRASKVPFLEIKEFLLYNLL